MPVEATKLKRKIRRGQTTRLVNEVKSVIQSGTSDVVSLQSMLDRLTTFNADLTALNAELEPHLPLESVDAEIQHSMDIEEQILDAMSILRTMIEQTRAVVVQTASGNSAMPHAQLESRHIGPTLPPLEIAPFSGDIMKWLPFWEQFEATIDRNNALTEIEKFYYLRTLLTGNAAASVANLPTTEACYPTAKDILKQRFGDTERIEQHYLYRLRFLQGVFSSSNTVALRRLYDELMSHIGGLTALNVPTTSYASMLIDILLRTFPQDIIVDYHRKKAHERTPSASSRTDSSEERLQNLLSFLRIEIESGEKCDAIPDSSTRRHDPQPESNTPPNKRRVPTISVFHNSDNNGKVSCCFCDDTDHRAEDCTSPVSEDDKKAILRREGRCFRCSTRGHRASDCRRRIVCRQCNGHHASSLCFPVCPKQPTSQEHISRAARAYYAADTSEKSTTDETILLQTFRVWAVSKEKRSFIRGLIDGGSQRSFIREDVSKKLMLPVVGEVALSINTFGKTSGAKKQSYRIVRRTLQSQYNENECTLDAVEVPDICQEILGDITIVPYVHRLMNSGRQIADLNKFGHSSETPGISVLIGADQMWLVMTPEVCRSTSSSLAAIKTIFGWTFQGATARKSDNMSPKCMLCVLPSLIAPQRDFDTKQKQCEYSEIENMAIEQTHHAERIGRTVFHDFENNLPKHDEQYHVSFSRKCALACSLKGNRYGFPRQPEILHLKFANEYKLSQPDAFMRNVSRGRQVNFSPAHISSTAADSCQHEAT